MDPFGVELDPDAGQRHSVVDAPTAGLAHAVGGDDRDTGGFGPCSKGRREGAATDQHRGLLAQPGARVGPVSYTHLDVYKRQASSRPR